MSCDSDQISSALNRSLFIYKIKILVKSILELQLRFAILMNMIVLIYNMIAEISFIV